MKYIFFGTPDFSAHLLKRLLENGIVPAAVVCNPDRPVGRKKIITPPPVKAVAAAANIEVLQPEKLDADFRERLRSFAADLFIVFAYSKIFRQEMLSIPRLGVVGVHPSFLPAYRGPSPFQTAILDGADKTGVTLYYLDEGIDSGPILAKSAPVAITDQDTFSSLAITLSDVGANLLIETLPEILAEKITPVAQDASQATYTKKFTAADGFVDEKDLSAAESGSDLSPGVPGREELARQILRKINAFNPEPGAWTLRNGKRVKLLAAEIKNDALKLKLIQEEGGKPHAI